MNDARAVPVLACRGLGQSLPYPSLLNPMLHGCGQQYFQHMPDTRQKLMTQVTVVNKLAIVS